nr:hypothetical protein T459_29898 [Ipomoea trifida]
MGIASKAGDWVFKIFTVGLGGATIFFAANLSLNVYRGKKWNTARLKSEEKPE